MAADSSPTQAEAGVQDEAVIETLATLEDPGPEQTIAEDGENVVASSPSTPLETGNQEEAVPQTHKQQSDGGRET